MGPPLKKAKSNSSLEYGIVKSGFKERLARQASAAFKKFRTMVTKKDSKQEAFQRNTVTSKTAPERKKGGRNVAQEIEYRPLPEELNNELESLCEEYAVEKAIWFQSPSNWNKVIVTGIGVRRIQKELYLLQEKYNDITFDPKDSSPLHTEQYEDSILLVEHTESSRERPPLTTSYATCDLILEDPESHRTSSSDRPHNPGSLYALTCAHLLLSNEQCLRLINSSDVSTIEAMRDELNSSCAQRQYNLKLRNGNNNMMTIALGNTSMFSYRHYYRRETCNRRQRTVCGTCRSEISDWSVCHHIYMNDIAILPIDHRAVEQLRHQVKEEPHKFFHLSFDGIKLIDLKELQIMKKVYVGRNSYMVHPGIHQPSRTREQHAHYVAFYSDNTPHKTGLLESGDSGSVVYVREGTKRLAVAILIGSFKHDMSIYQAVVLDQGLKDLKHDYETHLKNLRLFDLRSLAIPQEESSRETRVSSSNTTRPPLQ